MKSFIFLSFILLLLFSCQKNSSNPLSHKITYKANCENSTLSSVEYLDKDGSSVNVPLNGKTSWEISFDNQQATPRTLQIAAGCLSTSTNVTVSIYVDDNLVKSTTHTFVSTVIYTLSN